MLDESEGVRCPSSLCEGAATDKLTPSTVTAGS